MTKISRQIGDSYTRKPGTCKQKGNEAPRFPWAVDPMGRTALIFIYCLAHHLGYDDDEMARGRRWPDKREMYKIFTTTMPWFKDYYDSYRKNIAMSKSYHGPMVEFDMDKVMNRLMYNFTKPRRGGQERAYGMSDEHPLSAKQALPGGKREVWDRCSEEILQSRLPQRMTISMDEAVNWGRVSTKVNALL